MELIAGVQSTVTATIMPAVARDLGGLQYYGLSFGAFFLASLAATPLAGAAADRWGPSRPFGVTVAIFALGTILCSVANSMPLLAVFRAISGLGAGAQYVIAYGVIGKAYPQAARPRMLALLSVVWTIPGILGPAFGSLVAATVGWRWAFLAMLPFLFLAILLTMPKIAPLPPAPRGSTSLDPRHPTVLALGTGVLLASLSSARWQAIPLAVLGLGASVHALRRVLPAGSLTARPGIGAAVAADFLANLGFWMAYAFFPLLITQVRGRSLLEGGLAISMITIGWALGNWWQSRAVATQSNQRLVLLGCATLCFGLAVAATVIFDIPLVVVYGGWLVAGLGIGVFFPTVQLVALEATEPGHETKAIAGVQIATQLAMGLGAGIAGLAVAVAPMAHTTLAGALAGALALGVASALLGTIVATRIGTDHGMKTR